MRKEMNNEYAYTSSSTHLAAAFDCDTYGADTYGADTCTNSTSSTQQTATAQDSLASSGQVILLPAVIGTILIVIAIVLFVKMRKKAPQK